MFQNNIKTEPIPERVFELCKIVSKGELNEKEVKEMMEPAAINQKSTYFGIIREVCVQELNLISREDGKLKYVGEKKYIKDLNSFRKYCNSLVFKNQNTDFYKIIACFLDSDERWLKYTTLSDPILRKEVQDETHISLVSEDMMRGIRFWVSFLGFGYIHEGDPMYYLPNMHIALQDFCEFSKLEKNKEYTVAEFLNIINDYAAVALNKTEKTKRFNLAMSNALRQMHDSKEIVLKKVLDSREVWELYPDETHEFTDKITHIVYKGVKRG